MQFSEIPGHHDVKQNLIQTIKTGKVAHAQLFFSNKGGANLALAWAYAAYLNCEDKQENDSCGKCPSCSKIKKLIHPDLHFIYPVANSKAVDSKANSESYMIQWRQFLTNQPYGSLQDWSEAMQIENRQPSIAAEEARSIVKKISLKSFEGNYKILLIWLPELMNVSAANAILKILEEPPEKTLFLLVSNNHDKLLTTILSRTQKVMIKPFEHEDIVQYLVSHNLCKYDRAEKIAFLSDGSMNEAIQLTFQEEEDYHEWFRVWLRLCYTMKIKEISELGEKFQSLGREGQKIVLDYGIKCIRECLMMLLSPQQCRLRDSEKDFVEKFTKISTKEKLTQMSNLLNTAYGHIERNANPKILFLDLSIQLGQTFK